MTVSAQDSRRVIDNAEPLPPLTHAFFLENASYLTVYADEQALVQGADYTVSGVGDLAGYEVTILSPSSWSGTDRWVLDVVYPIEQPSDVDQGSEFWKRLEDAMDRMARGQQTMADDLKRSVKLPIDTPLATEVTIYQGSDGMIPVWEGDKLIPKAPAAAGDFPILIGPTGLDLLGTDTPDEALDVLGAGAGGKIIFGAASIDAIRDLLGVSSEAVNVKNFGAVGDGVTDDTDDINSALASAAASGISSVYFPTGNYLVTGLSVLATGMTLFGDGGSSILTLADGSDDHIIDLGVSSDILVTRLKLEGNFANQTTLGAYDTAGIRTAPGASNIRIIGNDILNCRGCGVLLQGVDTAMVRDNFIDQTWIYAGVECSGLSPSNDVSVIGNHISRTQTANVQATGGGTGGIVNWVVSGNILDGTDMGIGDPISDNVTGYAQPGDVISDVIVTDNLMKNSGNNGIHVGGDRLMVSNNTILNPLHAGIFLGKGPNPDPDDSIGFVCVGNIIQKNNPALTTANGIIVVNSLDGVISGNRINGCFEGIRVRGFTGSALKCQNITIFGNTMRGINDWHIRMFGGCSNSIIIGNVMQQGGTTLGGGIWLDNTDGANGNIAVKDNYMRNLPVGIQEDSGHTGCDISDNTYSNCTVDLTTAGTYTALDRGSRDRQLVVGVLFMASASNLAKPTWYEGLIMVSGTTNINTITVGRPNQIITLRFSAVLTVVDSTSLRLAGNFVTAVNSTLTLASDGTSWFELARSANGGP